MYLNIRLSISITLSFLSFLAVSAQQPVLKIPTVHTAWITGFDVSNNGNYVATCAYDNTVKLWDYRTKKELRIFTGHLSPANAVRFSPNDSLLISGGFDQSIKVWNIQNGEIIGTIDSMFDSPITDLCFSPDGRFIAGCSYKTISVMDLYSKKTIWTYNLSGTGKKIKFFPDGTKLACTESDSSFSVWSLNDTTVYNQKESFSYASGPINDFFFSRDGDILFAAVNSTINNIRIHNVGGVDSFRLPGHTRPPLAICKGETDDEFYSMSKFSNHDNSNDNIEIKKWSISQRKCIDSFNFRINNDGLANNITLTNEKEFAIANSNSIQFLDKNEAEITKKIKTRTTISTGIFQNDHILTCAAEDGIVRFFNTANNTMTIKNTYSHFNQSSFLKKNKSLIAFQRYLKDKIDLSQIIKYNLSNANTDTLYSNTNIAGGAPGLITSDNEVLLGFKYTGVKEGTLVRNSGRFLIYNIEEKKTIQSRSAATIFDAKFLPDNRSYVLCSGVSNILFLHRDSTKTELMDSVDKDVNYTSLELLDSTHVICGGGKGFSIWNIMTKKIENRVEVFENKRGVIYTALSADKKKLLISQEDKVKLVDLNTKTIKQTFTAEMGWIDQMEFSNDNKSIITASIDNCIRFWDIGTGKEKFKIIFIDSSDWIIITPEGYYQCTPKAAKLLHYVTKENKIITFEQLDTKYNRPDKVLEAMDNKDSILIKSYKKAYEKRISKMGIDTTSFRDGYGVPETDFVNRKSIAFQQKDSKLTLSIHAMDDNFKIDRLNIWINEVPIFGQRGFSVRDRNKYLLDTSITIQLSQGQNIIEASIINVKGTESYRIPLLVNYMPPIKQKEKTYFIGIGIDRFANSKYNLQYSSKDIRDLTTKLKEKYGNDITIDTLFNENVTVNNVAKLKQKLLNTNENDKVIISYSGHGLLSKDYDYYLSTYAINFEKPEQNGLPYNELESLLDSIPARKKLILVDACHSGEVDKEDLERIALSVKSNLAKGAQPLEYKNNKNHLGMKNSFELMQSLFVNVGKSTGATIISAAAGTQFAFENNTLKNGVFTYSILEAMNRHQSIKLSELKKIVGERVLELTNGLQTPTSRNEPIAVDWEVW